MITAKCVQCGVCIRSCPFDLLKADDSHFLVLVGGRRGRHPRIGRELLTLENEDLVIYVIEKIVYLGISPCMEWETAF